jgi:hypothetical protein
LRPHVGDPSGEPDTDIGDALLGAGEPYAAKRTIRQHSQIRGVILHLRRGQHRLASARLFGGTQNAIVDQFF